MSIKKIKEAQIPFEKLEKIGLTQQMVEDLPGDALDQILAGRMSPVLPLAVNSEVGDSFDTYGRFSLFEKPDGEIGVKIHPVMRPIGDTMQVAQINAENGLIEVIEIRTTDRYSQQVIDQLQKGKVVQDYMYEQDGCKVEAYLQLDQETNQIIGVPVKSIAQNLQIVALELDLNPAEGTCLQNGGLVTYSNDDDATITVGLDLHSPTGIRFAAGDQQKWQENSKRDWDKYELGVNGCWMTDDDGNLQYISEEDYDQFDVWNEAEKERARKAGAEPVRRGMSMR